MLSFVALTYARYKWRHLSNTSWWAAKRF